MPWAYIRRELAKGWCVPPWQVDEVDPEEVRIELRIRQIVAESERT